MKTFVTSIFSLAMLAACCLPASTALGGTLEAELDYKVRAIAQYMNTKNYESVSMLPIGGIAAATGTNRVGAVLQDKLSEHGIKLVGSNAPVQLDIEVSLGPKDATLFIEIELKTDRGQKLRDWTGQFDYEVGEEKKKIAVKVESGSTTAKVDHADDVAKILSIPYSNHHLSQTPKKANKQKLQGLNDAYSDPQSYVQKQSHVSSNEEALYEMEIVTTTDHNLATSSYHALSPTIESGFPFYKLNKGDMIGVRLHNNSDHVVAVEVCLDGIGSFHFSSLKNARHYQIQPRSSMLVRGFHQSFDKHTNIHRYKHFQIVNYSNSAWLQAQQSGFASVTESQGSISAHFSRELVLQRSGGGPVPADNDLIGQGKDFVEKAEVKHMKIGPIVETIVARYRKPKRL